jgi:RNA polymerase sigma factor for flagellar operon FliA
VRPSEATPAEALFVESLPILERVVAGFGRRYGMSADETADMASSIKLRIVEDDYAVFHKFRGESALATYLTVALTMMAREYCVQQRGRWRPSAAAQREGAAAVELESLVHRKGYPMREAAEVIRSHGTEISDGDLGTLLRRLPRREPLRPIEVGAESLDAQPGGGSAEEGVLTEESAQRRASVETVLAATMAELPLEDRLLLKLRFWHEASIADASRIHGVQQRPLYRRLEKLLEDLRRRLDREGITNEAVREMTGGSAS